ncbi:hypothetical protein ABBQ38_002310 [Trebouxia sp. C0009 RCD-2024]
MTSRCLARLFEQARLAAVLQYSHISPAASLPGRIDIAEQLKWRWSPDAWWRRWQESLWLAVPKKKVSPHRRGMRNAGKHRKMVPVMSRCKECSKVFPIHQLARCNVENCPGRFSQAA